MGGSFTHAKLKQPDLNHLAADGASNAIGSISEYESISRTDRANDVTFNVCYAHQNQRSGGYASGTIQFAEPVNVGLGEILIKSHQIQVRISRAPARMKVLRQVQESHQRKPMLSPNPAGETRWDGFAKETTRANMSMGDICETIQTLLADGGYDRGLITKEELASGDFSRHTYTNSNKMILRMFESAVEPATVFSKFTQDNRNTFSYVLFEARLAIAKSREDTITMYPGEYTFTYNCKRSSVN
jgi:hypothetical protein